MFMASACRCGYDWIKLRSCSKTYARRLDCGHRPVVVHHLRCHRVSGFERSAHSKTDRIARASPAGSRCRRTMCTLRSSFVVCVGSACLPTVALAACPSSFTDISLIRTRTERRRKGFAAGSAIRARLPRRPSCGQSYLLLRQSLAAWSSCTSIEPPRGSDAGVKAVKVRTNAERSSHLDAPFQARGPPVAPGAETNGFRVVDQVQSRCGIGLQTIGWSTY